jgi:hypothetical protein
MRPVALSLEGEYWDVQVYMGKLFLFTADGSLRVMDWDRVIHDQSKRSRYQDAYTFAFARNDIPRRIVSGSVPRYQTRITLEPSDLASLSKRPHEVSNKSLKRRVAMELDSPTPFPHSESHFYRSDLFVAGRSGAYRVDNLAQIERQDIASKPHRLWDAPTHHLSTSLAAVALAGGSEGLWQAPANQERTHAWSAPEGLSQVSPNHCTRCSWLYFSLFGSSHESGGYLASFRASLETNQRRQRQLNEVVPSEVLGASGYAWANANRICSTEYRQIRVFQYSELTNQPSYSTRNLESVVLSSEPGAAVRADVAPFGLIVEFENAFVVRTTGGDLIELPPEPVRWRCYPRAKHYFDQLHVVYDDRLMVYSFTEDSFATRNRPIGSRIPHIWSGRGTYDQYKAKLSR